MDPKAKTTKKTKLSHEDRHERFVEMAREVEASEDPKDFDKAFNRVTPSAPRSRPSGKQGAA